MVWKSITKIDMGIVASSKCMIWGNVRIIVDDKVITQIQENSDDNIDINIISLPICKQIQMHYPHQNSSKNTQIHILLIQKQSIFFQLVPIMKANNMHNKYIMITAKGYPDYITRLLLHQLCMNDHTLRVYYLGDYDVYGFDIFLGYALGDWYCPGVLENIELI